MRIWNGLERYPADLGRVVASIGNYDGVHLGHRAILDRVGTDARHLGLPALLITFEPHPLSVVAPERRPTLLQTRGQKFDCLHETGLSDLLVLEFSSELAALSGEEFFAHLYDAGIRFEALHVGENFRFGHRRSGDGALLERIGEERGFAVSIVDPVRIGDEVASSSAIRRAVSSGDVGTARRMLGRPYELIGQVIRGEGRGALLQYPTANLDTDNELFLAAGVYVTETVVLAARHASVTNVGTRPTFNGQRFTVESHLLDFEGDLYHESIAVRFLERLRDETRFANAADLADQIARDRAAAESYFQNLQIQSS